VLTPDELNQVMYALSTRHRKSPRPHITSCGTKPQNVLHARGGSLRPGKPLTCAHGPAGDRFIGKGASRPAAAPAPAAALRDDDFRYAKLAQIVGTPGAQSGVSKIHDRRGTIEADGNGRDPSTAEGPQYVGSVCRDERERGGRWAIVALLASEVQRC